jgi:transcription elongation GreA/GreB family factor
MKQKIHQQYQQIVNDRVDVLQDMITALTEDSKNDAKGSAGDKHETALSMMHLEQEKLNHKLSENLEQKAILSKIDASIIHKVIGLGSLVQTNHLLVYISTALPKIEVEDKTVFAVSPQSPLGNQLMGKKVGEEFEINGVKYNILEVF